MYIDAHIHLYDAEYKEIINDIIEEAFNHGIKYIVSVSEDS
ncbi:hydrolase TatD, partial [Candidatus Geothermarchaeota archaeon]